MLDLSLLENLINKIHQYTGTKSSFGSTGDLDIASAMKEANMQIDNTETYFSILDQRRLSNLNFSIFDADPARKRRFLFEALGLAEEQIILARNDKSFSVDRLLLLYFNFVKISFLVAKVLPLSQKNEIFTNIIYLIDSLESKSEFLNSWFQLLKVHILLELGYRNDASSLIEIAKKNYIQNFSDYYFKIQSEYGQSYWNDEIKNLEDQLSKK